MDLGDWQSVQSSESMTQGDKAARGRRACIREIGLDGERCELLRTREQLAGSRWQRRRNSGRGSVFERALRSSSIGHRPAGAFLY